MVTFCNLVVDNDNKALIFQQQSLHGLHYTSNIFSAKTAYDLNGRIKLNMHKKIINLRTNFLNYEKIHF